MYVEAVPNRGARPTILLREGWRENGRVKKRTVANLTKWPEGKVELLRRLLRDEPLVSPTDAFTVEQSLPHGHVEAVLGTIKRIGLDQVIAAKPCRERALVVAMLAEMLLHPSSKLGCTRLWSTSTLAAELGVEDADEDDLYAAMDWLVARQPRIEKKLAARHLASGAYVLYDVSSSFYEGRTCPLARFGYSRDRKRGKPIIVYGVLTDAAGCPVATEVYPGNTGDPTTVPDQVEKLRKRFELDRVVLVGDRGMLTETQIDHLKTHPGVGWISALRFDAVRKLVDDKHVQLSLFDERNLAEISSPDFPGERLVVCKNPALAQERHRKRQELLAATETNLDKLVREVARRTKKPLTQVEIARKAERALRRYKMSKHFELTIADGVFAYQRRDDTIAHEAELDGIYVIRTSEPAERLSSADAVRSYKRLSQVEQVFRNIKGIDRIVRPIRHREERRVRAHIFLCMLAYYVKWHMQQALAPLLFVDEERSERHATRDPVAPATASASAKRKKSSRRTEDKLPLHSFHTLLAELATRSRLRCRLRAAPHCPAVEQLTEPTPLQERAFQLLGLR
jgi:transposase